MIDTKSLLRWLRPEFEVLADKAFEGDLNAWNDLGLGLLSKWLDDGDDISLDRSVSCFLYAAKKGHAKAQLILR